MRTWWAGGAVLALALAGIVAASDDDAPPPTGWGAHGVYRHTDKPVEKPPEKDKVVVDEARPQTPSLERDRNAFTRRMAVCNRLRNIAMDTNDTELENQVNDLELRINKLWQQRAARLTASAGDDPAPRKSAPRKSKDSVNTTAGAQEVEP